jgi:hypothetical protein
MAIRPSSSVAESPSALPEQVLSRDPTVCEAESVGVGRMPSHLSIGGIHDEPRCSGRHDDRGDLRRSRARRDRHETRHVGTGIGDEGLGSVDDPFVAVEDRPGRCRTGIGAGVGFRESESGEFAPGDEIGEPPFLLRRRTELVDRVDPEAHRRLQRDGHGLVDPCDLLDGDAQAREIPTRPAPYLLGSDAEEPEVSHLSHDVGGEVVVAVPRLGLGCDALRCEVPNHGPKGEMFV